MAARRGRRSGDEPCRDDQWSVGSGYRRTWYQEFSYDTHLANGTKVEEIRAKTA